MGPVGLLLSKSPTHHECNVVKESLLPMPSFRIIGAGTSANSVSYGISAKSIVSPSSDPVGARDPSVLVTPFPYICTHSLFGARRHPTDHPEPARSPLVHSQERNPSPPNNPGSSQLQQSLPSIHELHPNLPQASLRASLPAPVPPYGPPPNMTYPVASGSNFGTHPAQEESDPEDQQEPPKKKRRRQALSCTECKRRKIKCDRAQPCGPCARRGEHLKCQWHIIEPMEKYVTRAEYDELKVRVYELESIVSRMRAAPSLPGRMTMSSPMIAMSPGSQADPIQGTMITPYHSGLTSAGPSAYHRMIPPTRSPPDRGESARGEPSSRPSHQPAARSPPPHRSPPSYPSSSRPLPMTGSSTVPTDSRASVSPERSSASSHPAPPSDSGSSVMTSRRASLSLAAITTPFIPESSTPSLTKKYQAQTPYQPGPQRLRPQPAYPGSAQVV